MEADTWFRSAAYLIPRAQREALIGDVLEDRAEQRADGAHRITIELRTVWHLAPGLKLWIAAIAGWIVRKIAGD